MWNITNSSGQVIAHIEGTISVEALETIAATYFAGHASGCYLQHDGSINVVNEWGNTLLHASEQ